MVPKNKISISTFINRRFWFIWVLTIGFVITVLGFQFPLADVSITKKKNLNGEEIVGENQDKYFVVFCADEGIPGHAFVCIGRESEKEQSSVVDGTWGMYPKEGKDGIKSVVIGEVPGKLKDDFLRNIDLSYILVVSNKEYNLVKDIIEKWKAKESYEPTKNDCLTFANEVATLFSHKIKVPKRQGLENLPAQYLRKLIELNKL